jgi:hypothetical protein
MSQLELPEKYKKFDLLMLLETAQNKNINLKIKI